MVGRNWQSYRRKHTQANTNTWTLTLSWCASRYSLTVASASCTACSGGYPAQTHHIKKMYSQFSWAGAVTYLCFCIRLLSVQLFSPQKFMGFFSLRYSKTTIFVFSLCFMSTLLIQWDTDTTYLLVTKRQMEKDRSASYAVIQQLRPFTAGKAMKIHHLAKTDILCDYPVIIDTQRESLAC